MIEAIELCNCNEPTASEIQLMIAHGILGFNPPSKESIFNDAPSEKPLLCKDLLAPRRPRHVSLGIELVQAWILIQQQNATATVMASTEANGLAEAKTVLKRLPLAMIIADVMLVRAAVSLRRAVAATNATRPSLLPMMLFFRKCWQHRMLL